MSDNLESSIIDSFGGVLAALSSPAATKDALDKVRAAVADAQEILTKARVERAALEDERKKLREERENAQADIGAAQQAREDLVQTRQAKRNLLTRTDAALAEQKETFLREMASRRKDWEVEVQGYETKRQQMTAELLGIQSELESHKALHEMTKSRLQDIRQALSGV